MSLFAGRLPRKIGFSGLAVLLWAAPLFAQEPLKITEQQARKAVLESRPVVYPPILRGSKMAGTVELEVLIGPDGTVKNTKVLQGHLLFGNAAVNCVQAWKFKPFTNDEGKPAPALVTLSFAFKP